LQVEGLVKPSFEVGVQAGQEVPGKEELVEQGEVGG
jgi:hypothetical protein